MVTGVMPMVSLAENSINELLALPETGMGFQLVEGSVLGARKRMLVFNAIEAIDLSDVGLEIGKDPAMVLRNGLRIIELLRIGAKTTLLSAPAPHNFVLLESRIASVTPMAAPRGPAPTIAMPSSLVKHVTLTATRPFHRFSAFNPDRRIHPVTGRFLPGTYGCPDSETPFVPTGFTAVGRFALPNNLPASHHYEIEAAIGTSIDFGTVAPAFGQAGGGVEAFFQHGAKDANLPRKSPSKVPDE
jgi:hypothetical protein